MDDALRKAASRLVEALLLRNRAVATAESCTGGLIGAAITSIPGSSQVFPGGVITYSNQAKESLLHVPTEVLSRYGAVSRECVIEMARAAQTLFDSDMAISVSGIAGPDGGTVEKPLGTVWIGLSYERSCEAARYQFDGNRADVRRASVIAAISLIIERLEMG